MTPRTIALVAIAGLLCLAPAAAGEEDPFADDEDPFDGEDPFAEYESQLADTVNATDSLADEDDEGEDAGGEADADDEAASTDGEETKDAPGLGLGLVALAGVLGALKARSGR